MLLSLTKNPNWRRPREQSEFVVYALFCLLFNIFFSAQLNNNNHIGKTQRMGNNLFMGILNFRKNSKKQIEIIFEKIELFINYTWSIYHLLKYVCNTS